MLTLANLHRAVQNTLASRRLGQPVFVRYTLQGSDKGAALVAKLVQAAAAVRDWLGQPLERVFAAGSAEGGHVALTLEFRDGGSALVSFARGAVRGSGVDLMVLGNRGAIYHDAGSGELWDEPAAGLPDKPDPKLQAAIERALRSGKPEPAES
jgi:predicted dehydrogenase